MNKEVYKEMCSKIYEGEDWDRMINCLERKDKEIERLNSIIKEVRERVLNENKPLPSAREIIEILDKVDKDV